MDKDSDPFQVVFNDRAQQKLDTDSFKATLQSLLHYLQLTDVEISLSVVSPEEIHTLNKKYRHIDRTTDILSFAMLEGEETSLSPETWMELRDEAIARGELPVLIGDLVISEAELGVNPMENMPHILRLIIHGILHLLGYDHQDDSQHARMEKRANDCFKYLFPKETDYGIE